MTIFILRASHANEFELQNYAPLGEKLDIRVVTSGHPLTPLSLPVVELKSPTDLPKFLLRRQVLNRAIGGEQWLLGLEQLVVDQHSNYSNNQSTGSEQVILHSAETYTPYTHQAVELRRQGKIAKLACTCWETIPHNNEKLGRLRQWKQESYKYVDLFHTPTERAKAALVAEGVDPAKIVVIPYGIDLTRFKPQAHRQKKQRPVVLTVARLKVEKGIADLEQVAARLPQYDFRVIGSGTYHPRSPNIRVKSVPYAQIHREYQAADLFFLPSRTTQTWEEQYGMALVEAMATGLPIVASDTGAISEVVGPAGVFPPAGDVAGMVAAIDGLLAYGCAADTLSRAGRARATRIYDAKKVARSLARLYSTA